MRKQLLSLVAVAALAMVGVGATTTAAQAAPEAVKISEVLIITAPNATTAPLSGVELVKPSGESIDGYRIESCNAAGMRSTIVTINDDDAKFQERTAASDVDGQYDYTFGSGASLDALGGVRVIDTTDNKVIDAVTFNSANPLVDDCLKFGDTNAPTPDAAPSPTPALTPQRTGTEDTGAFATAPAQPTFEPTSGSENTTENP